ncbi:preprotein translocase subunit SecG domain protein [Ancylostoma duodenale]|uniref:Preprotein translocase subunit SecG domain protein n=1 Tax=Ancylostoma duodenale TaxID=51022 RepID=A0A0C2G9K7_9BILA|nr:preprotein translocase subunit SecG domain protein [Ancylostoma duodenale]
MLIKNITVAYLVPYWFSLRHAILLDGRNPSSSAEPTGNTPKRMGGSGEAKAPSAHSQPQQSAPSQPPPAAPPAAAPARPPAPAAPPANDDGNYERSALERIHLRRHLLREQDV